MPSEEGPDVPDVADIPAAAQFRAGGSSTVLEVPCSRRRNSDKLF